MDELWVNLRKLASAAMVAVLDKAIEYNPRDRYPTAQAMLEGLQSSSSGVAKTAAQTQINFKRIQSSR